MTAALLTLLLPLLAGQPALSDVTGDAGVEVFVGNGGLTAGFTRYGQLAVLRWPSPGYSDHVYLLDRPGSPQRPDQGGLWGVETDSEFRWLLQDPTLRPRWQPSPPGLALLSLDDSTRGLSYTLESFVVDDADVLVMRLTVSPTPSRPRLFWYANLAPCTRLIPEVPIADWLLDGHNDFAVFAADAGTTIVHFRPDDPSQDDWDRAFRMFEENRTTGEWSSFAPGVYVAWAAEQPVVAHHCGREDSPSSAFTATAAGRLQGISSAAGACDAALEFIPEPDDGQYAATVFVSVASNVSDATAAVDRAKEQGYIRLREATIRGWRALVRDAAIPAGLPDDIRQRCRDALHAILVCRDGSSGAIVRRPSTQPPLALVWARYGVWISLALDALGLHEVAGENIEAMAATIRTGPDTPRPGSMPAATYPNGVPAFPEYINDIENTGWLLWSSAQHVWALPPEARAPWLESVWPKLAAASEFLASWMDARDGAPLQSFDWVKMQDDRQPRTALVAFLGVDAAVQMAELLDEDVPVLWRRRRNELDLWIQLRHLQRGGAWALADEGVFWLTEQARRPNAARSSGVEGGAARPIVNVDDPRWAARARMLVEAEALGMARLRDAAWMMPEGEAPVVTQDMLRVPAARFNDAVDAADYLLAVLASEGRLPTAE